VPVLLDLIYETFFFPSRPSPPLVRPIAHSFPTPLSDEFFFPKSPVYFLFLSFERSSHSLPSIRLVPIPHHDSDDRTSGREVGFRCRHLHTHTHARTNSNEHTFRYLLSVLYLQTRIRMRACVRMYTKYIVKTDRMYLYLLQWQAGKLWRGENSLFVYTRFHVYRATRWITTAIIIITLLLRRATRHNIYNVVRSVTKYTTPNTSRRDRTISTEIDDA